MNIRLLTAALLVTMMIVGCSKEAVDPCTHLDKVGPWTEVVTDQVAITYFFNCYDRWGVMYERDGYYEGLIPDDFSSDLETDSTMVTVCGYARENELPLAFPDPSFNNVYQFEAVSITKN